MRALVQLIKSLDVKMSKMKSLENYGDLEKNVINII